MCSISFVLFPQESASHLSCNCFIFEEKLFLIWRALQRRFRLAFIEQPVVEIDCSIVPFEVHRRSVLQMKYQLIAPSGNDSEHRRPFPPELFCYRRHWEKWLSKYNFRHYLDYLSLLHLYWRLRLSQQQNSSGTARWRGNWTSVSKSKEWLMFTHGL